MKLVSGIVDSGFFAQSALSAEVATKDSLGRNISETYLTGVDLSDYATENWVSSQGYLTAHQSLDGLMSADLLEISDNKITGYNGTAFAGQGGGVTGDYELSAGSGISIVDYPLEQKTVISVTAQGGNPEVEQAVIDNSATWNTVSDKLDTTAFSTVSGDFITALPQDLVYTADIADMATTGDLTGKQDITGMTAYATVESLTAKQDSGDYLSASDSANFLLTSDSGNFYPMNENPAGYLTAHQSLADYQTTADMVNYQTTAGMTAYLTAVPETYLQNTDLTISDGKITEISGVPLSAGTELEFEYDAADNISAINSSAISTTPSQALYAQNPLYFSATGTSSYMGINSADLARMLGVDETVLWSGSVYTTANSIHLSESPISFNKIRTITVPDRGTEGQRPAQINDFDMGWNTQVDANFFAQWQTHIIGSNTYSGETWYLSGLNGSQDFKLIAGTKQVNSTVSTGVTSYQGTLKQIIGIGRKEV